MLKLSLFDRAIIQFDSILRRSKNTINYPAQNIQAHDLPAKEKAASIRMLRINHSGEVCAQALYQGQALFARTNQQYLSLMQAANEENAHLNWCQQRLTELNARTSYLNPLWYAGSYAIGIAAGLYGDNVSLGFLAETEYQVTEHLEKHLDNISAQDHKSRAILEQMRRDELQHATHAIKAGGTELPGSVKILMRFTSKILTITAARL